MNLKIAGVGFGRASTLSVCVALNQPGFPSDHMFEMLENKDNTLYLVFRRRVVNTAAGTPFDWQL